MNAAKICKCVKMILKTRKEQETVLFVIVIFVLFINLFLFIDIKLFL
jgi:hypothetical protein